MQWQSQVDGFSKPGAYITLQTHCNVSNWWSCPLKSVEINTRAQVRSHQFDVALYIQHQVLRLQVSVHDVLLVEVGVGLHHTGSAEHSDGLVKTPSENHRDMSGWNTPLQDSLLCIALRHIYYLLPLPAADIFVLTLHQQLLGTEVDFIFVTIDWCGWQHSLYVFLSVMSVSYPLCSKQIVKSGDIPTLCILIFCSNWVEISKCLCLLWFLHFFEFGPDLSSNTELHDHVDVSCVFKSSMKPT